MQLLKSKIKCQECRRPATRRLGLFQAQDDFECYAESYVKCFWGMCSHHKSMDSFASESEQKVITTQPQSVCYSDRAHSDGMMTNVITMENPMLIAKKMVVTN